VAYLGNAVLASSTQLQHLASYQRRGASTLTERTKVKVHSALEQSLGGIQEELRQQEAIVEEMLACLQAMEVDAVHRPLGSQEALLHCASVYESHRSELISKRQASRCGQRLLLIKP
jgi:hypothetical protein